MHLVAGGYLFSEIVFLETFTNYLDISISIDYSPQYKLLATYLAAAFSCLRTMYRFGKQAAKSFVMPEERLNSFRMHYVQPHYLVSTFICHVAGGGVV